MLVLRTVMILDKIMPKEFDLNDYIGKIYEDIQTNNSGLLFTKQYLLNKLLFIVCVNNFIYLYYI